MIKETEYRSEMIPISISKDAPDNAIQQITSYVGEVIGEAVFKEIKNNNDTEFDITYTIKPKRLRNKE